MMMMRMMEPGPEWAVAYKFGGEWVALPRDPEAAAWGLGPQPPPPRRHDPWRDRVERSLLVLGIYTLAALFCHLFLGDPDVLSALAMLPVPTILLQRATTTASSSSSLSSAAPSACTALALLPTCPALAPPPMCYEWERPATMVPLGSGSSVRVWSSANQQLDDDYKQAAIAMAECFDSLVRDAARSCNRRGDEQDVDYDYMTAIKCFDSLVADAARTCGSLWAWGYDNDDDTAALLALPSDDLPPT